MTARAATLLQWYDRNAREMPWRVSPADRLDGVRPDPYRVWLSEVMLQQTTVAAVTGYFQRFTTLWPDVMVLARADDAAVMGEWAGLGYYARARNLLKCARVVADDLGGCFPDTREGLMALPGVGPYTAAAIASIAFDRPETVVDGNVERVMARLHDIHTPLPKAKVELTNLAKALTPSNRPGDYAQAVMDLGATICTPRNPACGFCPWRPECEGCAKGTATDLPRREPKKPKPTRHGYVYIARRGDGAMLLERRPDNGLLGGMLGWPGSDWEEQPQPAPPVRADWKELPAQVLHTFTHFHLRLTVLVADVPAGAEPWAGEFLPRATFRPSDLPTVMRKAFDLARDQFENDR
ncbi:A/G-specific adenine glycosylase [Thalassovita sp.]|uniref:A/G-specific adenine glycosylase n=1 Tax=Thalassovita sp. TaxID=1979401 RepID=UPI0039B6F056